MRRTEAELVRRYGSLHQRISRINEVLEKRLALQSGI